MTTIYDQHAIAFSNVSAYVIINGAGERVATIAFKFPKDGAGRLWCYLHWIGAEMVRDYAGGYGYDKRSAAIANANDKLKDIANIGRVVSKEGAIAASYSDLYQFYNALNTIGGKDWSDALREAGFTVLQAV